MARIIRQGDDDYAALVQASARWGIHVFWDDVYWLKVLDGDGVYFVEIPREENIDKSSIRHRPFKREWYGLYGPGEVREE